MQGYRWNKYVKKVSLNFEINKRGELGFGCENTSILIVKKTCNFGFISTNSHLWFYRNIYACLLYGFVSNFIFHNIKH